MPHTSSAKKAMRQDEKRRLHNRAIKKDLKMTIKKFLVGLKDGTPEQKQANFNLASKKLDKAASKRIISKNLASRKKSQLALRLKPKATTPTA